jgi:predicted Ser/Thr protein kinase
MDADRYLAPGSRFAGYVIEGVAGRGGMGIVYRARQVRPSRTVALKVISPDLAADPGFRERFEHESEIAASIEHSNVIPVYEVGEESRLLYIVMRYVEGTDLGSVIAARGRLSPRETVRILDQLTAALDAAHARGLVHRDIKPANVLIAQEGGRDHVYLTDFGLAKLTAGTDMTRSGTFVGTLAYAAPEQFEGRRVDARTDVYAGGGVLYHMLTGRVPFPRDSDAAIMWAHLSAEPPSVREVVPLSPPQLDEVIARAMAKEPQNRYPSAGDLGRDASAAAEGQRATVVERSVAVGPAAPDADTEVPAAPHDRRLRAPTGAVGAAALIAVALAVIAISGAFGGSGHPAAKTRRGGSTTPTTPPAPTTKNYANAAVGISFSYPASWQALNLKGAVVDLGIGNGTPAETRCAVVLERGAGPASSSQEARFAYVRQASANGARAHRHYVIRAIQTEQGANTLGVGLVRVADTQGGHLGFFFRGRDVIVFDCVTAAGILDRVDQQYFRPLLATVTIS